jgi:hypothetical protein
MKKNSQKNQKKIEYEPPRMISIAGINIANGARCALGSSADDKCQAGSMAAGNQCHSGGVAPGGNCIEGAYPR